ncbi:MAG: SIMPL domain-containing protein [Firmicutes bacterium]|nr:SIMPL domain-containing protein [Bacillota bacterium]MDD4263708.1 SIMPL domain-containing protein [Bacillota bacterium]MDD4694699.1 SIMPL domain-containing protein [Bacillota bacterium]
MDTKVKPALILGVAILLSALTLGLFFFNAQKQSGTISVVGQAIQGFEADTVKWVVTIEEETGPNDLISGYRQLEDGVRNLREYLATQGITASEISVKTPNIYKDFNYDLGVVTRIRYQQTVFVITEQLDIVEDLAYNPVELLEANVNIINSNVEFYYSHIDELKKTLVSEATANAKERAKMMLEQTDVNLGKLISVRSGVFQITEPYSTEVSSLGIYDTSTRKKQISVTASTVFQIK